ncbi:hypothetical protein [Mycobacterium sp.]|nr:hypothetical protein [Mycobacterium sp.]HZA10203.1 hypothetical protein [Mycobacterium sp.]
MPNSLRHLKRRRAHKPQAGQHMIAAVGGSELVGSAVPSWSDRR